MVNIPQQPTTFRKLLTASRLILAFRVGFKACPTLETLPKQILTSEYSECVNDFEPRKGLDLQQQFQDSLDVLLRTQANILESCLPTQLGFELFADAVRPTYSLMPSDNHRWGMTLTLCAEYLNRRFFPHPGKPDTRHGLGVGTDESNSFTFIWETLVLEENAYLVIMERSAVDEFWI